ncbi:MAG: response regulator transcription factor [Xanthomonadales bacterium]|nr:response regulator transcription factor [Xanthomonadales bacterium]
MIKVLLIDDHAMIREGCRRVLESAGGVDVVGQAGSAEEGLVLARKLRPDVIVLDLRLPGMSGLEATERLLAACEGLRILVLTMIDQLPMPTRLIQAGASGYLTKDAPAEELVRAVREVSEGRKYLCQRVANDMALGSLRAGGRGSVVELLTSRELEVALRLAGGSCNRDIAEQLHISEKTVSTHKTRVLEKLGVASTVALASMLVNHGLVVPDGL